MSTWNAAFEATPAGIDNPAQGDDRIRELKADTRLRLAKEHKMYTTGADGTEAADGWHKAGSAMIYVAPSPPTTRPDGTTALNADDNGRLWYDTTNAVLKYYAHPSWTTVPAVIGDDFVTNAKLANMAQATVKGRIAGSGTGDPVDLTAAQLIDIIETADGPGSGLDADTVSGRGIGVAVEASVPGGNMDAVNIPGGMYRVFGATAGTKPSGVNEATLIVQRLNNVQGTQILIPYNQVGMYVRTNDSLGAYTAWQKVWTSLNDGPGSGLRPDYSIDWNIREGSTNNTSYATFFNAIFDLITASARYTPANGFMLLTGTGTIVSVIGIYTNSATSINIIGYNPATGVPIDITVNQADGNPLVDEYRIAIFRTKS